jgi:hypothetical protein
MMRIADILAKVYNHDKLYRDHEVDKVVRVPLVGAVLTRSDLNREMVR